MELCQGSLMLWWSEFRGFQSKTFSSIGFMKGWGQSIDAEQGRPRGSIRSLTTEGCREISGGLILPPSKYHLSSWPVRDRVYTSFLSESGVFSGDKRGSVPSSGESIQIRARTAEFRGHRTSPEARLTRKGRIEREDVQGRGGRSSSLLRKNRASFTWPAFCGITTTSHRPLDPLRLSTTLEVDSGLPNDAKWTRTALTMTLAYPQSPQSPLSSVYRAPSAFVSTVPPKKHTCS